MVKCGWERGVDVWEKSVMSSNDKERTKDGIVCMDGRRGAEPSLFVVEPRACAVRAKQSPEHNLSTSIEAHMKSQTAMETVYFL